MKSNILYDEQRIKVAQEALSGTKLSYVFCQVKFPGFINSFSLV
ncbi:hypothetical protein [Paenibacillus alginolyticus]|nr:hypothetical protein [Paenibacillus alginolyticus]